jgi:hypothetical protein
MIAWFARLLRRTPAAESPAPPPAPPRDETVARQTRAAIEHLDVTTQRIDAVLDAVRERQRQEDLRRIRRTGNFAEGWLVPERRKEES